MRACISIYQTDIYFLFESVLDTSKTIQSLNIFLPTSSQRWQAYVNAAQSVGVCSFCIRLLLHKTMWCSKR